MSNALVALLSALLGAVVGGIVAGKVNIWTARRQLTREMRVQLYLAALPELQADVARRWLALEQAQAPARLDSLLQQFSGMHRLATVAGSEDRRMVDQLRKHVDHLVQLDLQLWGADPNVWGVLTEEVQKKTAGHMKESLNELSIGLNAYGDWLASHLD